MLPFMLPHLVALSSALKPPSTPVVDFQTERSLDEFMAYYRATWLPPNRQFSLACDHSQNRSTRTTNFVEEFHSKIRASYSTGTPSLDEMLKFCAAEVTMAKTLEISFGNGSLKDRYIRSSDEVRQRNILCTMANFQQHIVQLAAIDRFPTRRELKRLQYYFKKE